MSAARSTEPEAAAPVVLIVEDYADARLMYGVRLRRAGFRVAYAEDGDEALQLARELRPRVIVMDLALPTKDGWTVTRELREDGATARIPIVAVSGHVTPECIAAAYDAGCNVFLPKPCLPDVLAGEVERLAAFGADTTR